MFLLLGDRITFDLMHPFMFLFCFLLCTKLIRLPYLYVDSMPRFTCYSVKNISGSFFILSTTFPLNNLKSMFLNSMQITLVSPQNLYCSTAK